MTINCYKCGRVLDATPFGKGRGAVLRMADHHTRFGCDYPASHVDLLTKKLFPQLPSVPLKKEEKSN